jgi:hypothetical protein
MNLTIDGDGHAGLDSRQYTGMEHIDLTQGRPDGRGLDFEAGLPTGEVEQALVDRTQNSHDRYSASSTRMGVSGSACIGCPVTLLMAQAIAARGGTMGASPTPLAPYG